METEEGEWFDLKLWESGKVLLLIKCTYYAPVGDDGHASASVRMQRV